MIYKKNFIVLCPYSFSIFNFPMKVPVVIQQIDVHLHEFKTYKNMITFIICLAILILGYVFIQNSLNEHLVQTPINPLRPTNSTTR